MKCPKCGFTSFDFLEDCKKCGQELQTHKSKFGLRSLIFPNLGGEPAPVEEATDTGETPAAAAGEGLDFGFDFMSEEGSAEATPTETPAPEEAVADEATDEDFSFDAEDEADDGFEFATDADTEESDGFEFTEAEDSSDDFDFSEEEPVATTTETDGADEFAFAEADQELDGEQGDDDLDFSDTAEESSELGDWDEPEEATDDDDRAKQSADAEDPSDPFELRGPAESERVPGDFLPETSRDSGAPDVLDTPSSIEGQDALASKTELPAGGEASTELFDLSEPAEFEQAPEDVPPESEASDVWETASPFVAQDEVAPELEPVDEDESPGLTVAESEAATQPTLFGFQDEAERAAAADEFEHADIFSDAVENTSETGAATCPSLTPRLAAGVCDLLILAVVFLLFLAAGELTLAETERSGLLPGMETLLALSGPYFLVFFALCFGYFTLFHFLTGQTPGKMLFGLRVEDLTGNPLNLSQAFLRSVGGLFSLLPAGLGYLAILFSSSRRGWNDLLAGSRLVLANEPGDGPFGEFEPDN